MNRVSRNLWENTDRKTIDELTCTARDDSDVVSWCIITQVLMRGRYIRDRG